MQERTKKSRRRPHGLLWLVLASPAVPGQTTDESRLPTVVITPARSVQAIDAALPATTIITRADIERWQLTDLVGALAREAGVQFAQSGGSGSAASLFLRGANSSQVLVLVDGVPLNAAVGGAATLGGIALDTIERIEIARGNLSSLYGSAAIGGVVQIFTRAGGRPGATLSVEGGGGRTLAGAASARGDLGGFNLGAALGGRRSEAFSAIDTTELVPGPFAPGANPDDDGNRNASGSFGATYRTADGSVLAINAWSSHNKTEFDSTADGPTATHEERSTLTVWNVRARTTPLARWETQLQFGQSRDHSRNESSEPFSFNNGEFESDNQQIAWTNDIALTEQVKAQLGFEHLRQDGASTAFDPTFSNLLTEFSRTVSSGWAGISGAQQRHLFQLNVRHDHYSDVGGATTGLAGYGYRLTPQVRAIAQVSNAFRAPSFNDLYFPFFGNSELEPERSRSAEVGVHWVDGATTLRAALFRTDTRDLIVFDPISQRAQNVDRARATGAELAASGRHGPWVWSGSINAVRAVDVETDSPLLRRAPYTVNGNLAYDTGHWRAGIEVAYVGPRDDLDINTFARTELDAYTLVRAVAAWWLTPALALRARIENATDARYQTVSGYNVQPRTFIVGFELRN
jgi:vitamin B12 transporter